ncbi:hypothetical protein [Lacrimispora amygdalina]|uniref:hypothetical protein n=1 Tax=Lacrimispora amygdalina TaxID=253257 RepID=UPI000BE29FA6|nr:hypothetical protein [Lacrimispora amygdalina]
MKKGTYVDEKIISLQNFVKKRTSSYELLTDEIPIRGKGIRFIPLPMFDGKVNALIPQNFTEMPEMIAKVRYISSNRPPVLLTNEYYDDNFGFHLLRRGDIQEYTNLDELIHQMQDTVKLHTPETVIYGKGSINLERADGRWFEYKNFTLDDETYNLQFLVSTEEYLLAGTFNCRMCFYDDWRESVLKSLEYIKITGKGELKNESR